MELKGSKTEANLREAFAGESQARNKYTYWASKARKDGFEHVARIFEETAENEKEHAKLWFKRLGGVNDTVANLLDAAGGEKEEWSGMYKRMAQEARAEGFDEIAEQFDHVGSIEKHHEERYLMLAKEIKDGTMFVRKMDVTWECLNCGFHLKGTGAPDVCPACFHPQAYFVVVRG